MAAYLRLGMCELIIHYISLFSLLACGVETPVLNDPVESDTATSSKLPKFKIDTAYLFINSTLAYDIAVWNQSSLCYQCKLTKHEETVPAQGALSKAVRVDSNFPLRLAITHDNNTNSENQLCNITYRFQEYGYYMAIITRSSIVANDCKLNIVKTKEGINTYSPIYIAIAIYTGLIICYFVAMFIYKNQQWVYKTLCCLETERLVNSDLGSPIRPSQSTEVAAVASTVSENGQLNHKSGTKASSKPRRLQSLDTFRGISIVIMIFVNYGGGEYWFFKHSKWNGLTVADLVFPWFIFIMGTSLALSFHGLRLKNVNRFTIFLKILRRTVILFSLGLILNTHNGHNDLTELRIPGVLQRFSISYLVVAVLELLLGTSTDNNRHKWFAAVRDILDNWAQWLLMLALLVLYLCLTLFLPVPNCPNGYLGPGGPLVPEFRSQSVENCTGGAAGYVDRWLFGSDHIYQTPTFRKVYLTTLPYDPEGILGSLTSIFITFLGSQAGKILLTYEHWGSRVKRWSIWAVLLGTLAGVLCRFSQNDGWIPINKNLWSVSYIMCMASFSFMLLTICYSLVDVSNVWSGAPFYFCGMNSILLYCGHEIMSDYFPFSWHCEQSHGENLASDLIGTTLWVVIAKYLHHHGFFLKI